MRVTVLRTPPLLAVSIYGLVFGPFGMQDSLTVYRNGALWTTSEEQSVLFGGVYALDEVASVVLLPVRLPVFGDVVIFKSNLMLQSDVTQTQIYAGRFPTGSETVMFPSNLLLDHDIATPQMMPLDTAGASDTVNMAPPTPVSHTVTVTLT